MIEFIKMIAREAGHTALAEMKRLTPEQIHAKGTEKDLVTETDRKIEEQLITAIRNAFPQHDICGEETGLSGDRSEFRWIIDPIDGTNSYIHQTPYFSISIGLQHNGETIAGAVYAPKLDELFWAEKGGGAFLNGERIGVSQRTVLGQSLLATGFACLRAGLRENNLKHFLRIMPDICDIRRCGSAAVDLAYVACGRYEGFWEMNLNVYDIAAGVLLVKEAGGAVSDMSGMENFPRCGIVASNGLLHDRLLRYFKEN